SRDVARVGVHRGVAHRGCLDGSSRDTLKRGEELVFPYNARARVIDLTAVETDLTDGGVRAVRAAR
ncbi:MAG TPA: hypothetical protein VF821_01555, partial [Lentzea sp.]